MHESLIDRISIDSNICHGEACIKGTRIPVHQIVGMLANGESFESLLKAFPNISTKDIEACSYWTDLNAAAKEHLPTW